MQKSVISKKFSDFWRALHKLSVLQDIQFVKFVVKNRLFLRKILTSNSWYFTNIWHALKFRVNTFITKYKKWVLLF